MITIRQVFHCADAIKMCSVFAMLLCSPVAFAATNSEVIFDNPLKYDTLEDLLIALVDGITIVLIPIIVLSIVFIGFKMVLAGREKTADYTKLKAAFGWSLVGLFLVLGARGILAVIQNTVDDVLEDEYKVGSLGDDSSCAPSSREGMEVLLSGGGYCNCYFEIEPYSQDNHLYDAGSKYTVTSFIKPLSSAEECKGQIEIECEDGEWVLHDNDRFESCN